MAGMRQLVLGMMLGTTPLAAQGRGPGFDPASGPFSAGVGATIVPIVGGIAMMVAAKGEMHEGASAAGLLLATGGLLLGPAVGDWAGGLSGRGFARLGLRSAAFLGGMVGGFAIAWNNSDQNAASGAVFLGGVGIAAGLAVWDLATLKGAVRRKRGQAVSVAPVVQPDRKTLGIAVHLAF